MSLFTSKAEKAAKKEREAAGRAGEALGKDVEALGRVVEIGEGLLPGAQLDRARLLVERAGERQSFTSGRIVVATLGATGSGKSSLVNALVGREVARVAARRPTTSRPMAAVWGADDAGELLDWLDVPERVQATRPRELPVGPNGEDLSGLVLLDMPDIDSTHTEHRTTVQRLAGAVDVLMWVLDPQKYADASIHHDFLRPMAEHAQVTMVVLNQVDTLEPGERERIVTDLQRILAEDGLGQVHVHAVSARTDEGVEELLGELAQVATSTRAVHERLRADVRSTGQDLARATDLDVDGAERTSAVPEDGVEKLVTAATAAAGTDAVCAAVERSYRRRAGAHVGWPPVRWLAGLKSDPVENLHLGGSDLNAELVRSSLPQATPVQEAGVRSSAQKLALAAGADLPDEWRARLLEQTNAAVPAMIKDLDRAVVGTDTENDVTPAWWHVVGFLQWLALAVAVVGLGWLAVIWAAGYLQFDITTPFWGPVPVPSGLLLGGLLAGLLLWWLGASAARVGARRRAARVRARIRESVAENVRSGLVGPMREDLQDFDEVRTLVRRLARGS